MLLLTVVSLHLHLLYPFLLNEISFVLKTSQHNLITSQVHQRIREYIKYFSKYLLYELIGLIKCHIQRTHESSAKSAGNPFVFGCQTPACSMSRSIKFRNNTDSSSKSVLNNISCLRSRISLFGWVWGVLCNLRMGVKDKREGILIDNMPMEHIQFVVHHSINGFVDEVDWKEMSWSINHESPVDKGRLVFNDERQVFKLAAFYSMAWTVNWLYEGLQCSHKTYICCCWNRTFLLIHIQLITLFWFGKYTL